MGTGKAYWTASALALWLAPGCTPPVLSPADSLQRVDFAWDFGARAKSDSRFAGARKSFRRVMIVPPSGTARGGFERELSVFEKKFIEVGVTLISPAVTGRVASAGEEKHGGQELSDVERALILAKKSGAEVLLQVGFMGSGPPRDRALCGTRPEALGGCKDPTDWKAAPWKVGLRGPTLRFEGRLINVENGEIIASLDIAQAVMNNLKAGMSRAVNSFTREAAQVGTAVEVLGGDDVPDAYRGQWLKARIVGPPCEGFACSPDEFLIKYADRDGAYKYTAFVNVSRMRRVSPLAPAPGSDEASGVVSCPPEKDAPDHGCERAEELTRTEIITLVVRLVSGPEGAQPAPAPAAAPQEFGGVGAVLNLDGYARTVVNSVVPGSPAARAGLKPGDGIIAVDGVPTAGMTLQAVTEKVRGTVGTKVVFDVQPKGSPDPVKIDMLREKITAP